MTWLVKTAPERYGRRINDFPIRSLFLDGAVLIGVFIGVRLFCVADSDTKRAFVQLLMTEGVEPTVKAAIAAMSQSLLLPLLLLLLLFLTGLSPCGIAVAGVVPLCYGITLGMTLARMYSVGSVGIVLAVVITLPAALMMREALRRSCTGCMRMSQLILAQLRPSSAHCGGLQTEFRLFCLHCAFAFAWIFAAGVWDVLARMLCSRWL